MKGLRQDADDCLIKPFEIVELWHELRLSSGVAIKDECGSCCVEFDFAPGTKGESEVELTPKEYVLLAMRLQNQNIALFGKAIFQRV